MEQTNNFPKNCNHPFIEMAHSCKAIHLSNTDCGCYYCVFNKKFNQAPLHVYEQEETFGDDAV